MALDQRVKDLAINVALNKPAGDFSTGDLQEALRVEMSKLIGNGTENKIDFYKWEQNKLVVFEIMSTMIEAALPVKVQPLLRFADFKTFNHGDKPRFTIIKGKQNVKRFVTKVASAGVYERVRLDRTYFDVETYAHGGAVYQTLEGFLSNRENINDVLDILIEGMTDAVYSDIATALNGTLASMPAANKHTANSFAETEFNRILNTVRAYGEPTIFCTPEFAATITPSASFIGDADKADMRNQGYIGRYNGADVVLLNQSFTDETNTTKVVDPQFAYVIPSGASEMPVKVAFEGETLIKQVDNADWSVEIQAFKKIGVTILNTNFYGMYKNTSL